MLKTGFKYKYYLFSLTYTIHIVYLHCTSTLIAPDSFIGAVYKLTLNKKLMKARLFMFSLLATVAMTSVFANESNNEVSPSKETQQQKVDQKVNPKSYNYIMFDNKTGEGNSVRQVNYDTMDMTFAVAAQKAVRELQLPRQYTDYVWKNEQGKVLDFNGQCTAQGVHNASTVTITR